MHRILRNFMQNTNAKAVYTRICHRRHRHGNSSRSSSNTSNNSISNNCNCNKNNGKRSWSIKWCTYPSQKHNENVKHTFDQHCRAQREMNTQSLNPSLPLSPHPAQKAECCLSVWVSLCSSPTATPSATLAMPSVSLSVRQMHFECFGMSAWYMQLIGWAEVGESGKGSGRKPSRRTDQSGGNLINAMSLTGNSSRGSKAAS